MRELLGGQTQRQIHRQTDRHTETHIFIGKQGMAREIYKEKAEHRETGWKAVLRRPLVVSLGP